jgi:6-pyruvoyltetrahydropterin/6-carboxytetrahydropterin synthase
MANDTQSDASDGTRTGGEAHGRDGGLESIASSRARTLESATTHATTHAKTHAAPYALEVECEFAAAHAILLGGVRERLHGHNWRVVISIAGDRLDREELLCDFHLVERLLSETIAPFRDGNLNETPPFDRVNPTAEAVARFVATELTERLARAIPAVQLEWVRVTEAPRCTAIVRMTR